MKTAKKPVDKRSHPLTIFNEEVKRVLQPKNASASADLPDIEQPDTTMDKPENWDEAWFASYE